MTGLKLSVHILDVYCCSIYSLVPLLREQKRVHKSIPVQTFSCEHCLIKHFFIYVTLRSVTVTCIYSLTADRQSHPDCLRGRAGLSCLMLPLVLSGLMNCQLGLFKDLHGLHL